MAVSKGATVGGGIAGGITLLVSVVVGVMGGPADNNASATITANPDAGLTDQLLALYDPIVDGARNGEDPRNIVALCNTFLERQPEGSFADSVRRIRAEQRLRLPIEVPVRSFAVDLARLPEALATRWRTLLETRSMQFDLRADLVARDSPAQYALLLTPRSRDQVRMTGTRVELGWTSARLQVPGTDRMGPSGSAWKLVVRLQAAEPGGGAPRGTLDVTFAIPDNWRGPPLVTRLESSDPPGCMLELGEWPGSNE